jgi:hypothetical protein
MMAEPRFREIPLASDMLDGDGSILLRAEHERDDALADVDLKRFDIIASIIRRVDGTSHEEIDLRLTCSSAEILFYLPFKTAFKLGLALVKACGPDRNWPDGHFAEVGASVDSRAQEEPAS